MYDIDMEPFFHHHRDPEHPLLAEIQILSHILHRHVAAHEDIFQ